MGPRPGSRGPRWARPRGPDSEAAGYEVLESLAGLLRAGLTPAQALQAWPHLLAAGARDGPLRVARRVRLGASPAQAVARHPGLPGCEAALLAGLLEIHGRLGGDAARMVEAAARAAERRRRARADADAATAGARLSARMVAALPVAFVPLTPLAHAPLLDGPGAATAVLGGALAAAGFRWMGRLVPRPPPPDGVGLVAEVVAAVAAGGVDCGAALATIAALAPAGVQPGLERARRLVALGAAWSEALERSGDDGLARLGAVLARSLSLGLPVAGALVAFAEVRRAEQAADLSARLRRAPVAMTVPLALCVLPSFLLLAVAPFVRALAGS